MDDPSDPMRPLLTVLSMVLYLIISIAYTAVVALNDARLHTMIQEGKRTAKQIASLAGRGQKLQETVRLCGVLLGFVFATNVLLLYEPSLKKLLPFDGVPATLVSGCICVTVAGSLWLLICEMLPRRVVTPNAQGVAVATAWLLSGVYILLTPLRVLLSAATNLAARVFGVDPHASQEEITEEEIRMLVDVGEESGVIEGSQKEMINNIFEFDDITAQEIMTPRTDMTAIPADTGVPQAMETAVKNGVSRLPVYEGDIDHCIGVLYCKDLLPYVGKPLPGKVTVQTVMREPLFVPETKRCKELFSEMTALHTQMAMVVDEYGGIAGIVTMEDLLESIVGSMQDEYDNEKEEVTRLSEGVYDIDGAMDIDQVAELLEVEIPKEDYDTLGGFLLERLGRVPTPQEHPAVDWEGYRFTVLRMQDKRIDSVHVEKLPNEEEPPQE